MYRGRILNQFALECAEPASKYSRYLGLRIHDLAKFLRSPSHLGIGGTLRAAIHKA